MERLFCIGKKDFCDNPVVCGSCDFMDGAGSVDEWTLSALIPALFGENYDLDRLKELVQADREGRCMVLPVKPRETFYTIDRVKTLCHLGYYFDEYDCQGCEEVCDSKLDFEVRKNSCYNKSQILPFMESQKKIYLSEQEAESALKAMKERENNG